LEDGGSIVQETRLYDADLDETRSMRSKEEANDYRYFPDPDLLPLAIDAEFVTAATEGLPELPDAMRARFAEQYGLSTADATTLTSSLAMADYFERAAAGCKDAKLAANWISGALAAALNKADLDIGACPVSPEQLIGLLQRIEDNSISGKIAKQVFEGLWAGEGDADAVIEARGLKQITDSGAIAGIVDTVIAANPQQVEQYRAGKEKVFGFFVGQVMKQSQGKANPGVVNQLLKDKLAGD